MFVKRTQQWARVTTTTRNYPLQCVYIHKISHKWCWWRLNDDDEREKVWLGLSWDILWDEKLLFAISFLPFLYIYEKINSSLWWWEIFSTSHFRNAFVFVRSLLKNIFLWHPCRVNFSFSFSHGFFLTNAYTAINNEVKIAWMCIKCIITHGAVNDDERRICVTKNALWRTFVYLMHMKEVEKIHFIACNYARHALFLLLLLRRFFASLFSIMHRFLPSHCDGCASCSCVY